MVSASSRRHACACMGAQKEARLERICVFAGSRPGNRIEYSEVARALGQELAARSVTLVYGGGGVGLMGVVADATLDSGGQVIGVMPRGLFAAEVAHRQLTELHEVGTMHERKRMMYDLADAFIALPGGLGTFDELVEIITWAQIGIHHKPIVLINVAAYFDPLLAAIGHAIAEGFVEANYRTLVTIATDPTAAVERLMTTPATANPAANAAAIEAPAPASANGHVANSHTANSAAGGRSHGAHAGRGAPARSESLPKP